MLKNLLIENLALVERQELKFEPGLTVLTGETGAGKSVVVNALSLALGERGEREQIRFKADSCSVTAVFEVARMSTEYKKHFANLIENGELTILREISRTGKSRVRINNQNLTLNQLRELTSPLAEILGQHANQLLMNEDNHLDFLDRFAVLEAVKATVSELYNQWRQSNDELARLTREAASIKREQELLEFQKNEIEKARLTIGEEEALLQEKRILDSARLLMSSADSLNRLITEDEHSLTSLLRVAEKELDKMAQTDPMLQGRVEDIVDISYRLADLARYIEQYGASVTDSPERIEEINLRLDEIYKLKKKYGGSEQAILASLDIIKNKLGAIPANIDSYIEQLEKKTLKQFSVFSEQALALSDTRTKAAGYLKKLVEKELAELAIDKARFEIEFLYEADPNGVIINGRAVKPSANGLETGRFLFSANPGEPLKSLVKTASGGEISRVLLALKSAEKKNSKLPPSLLVFDEVDSGIGGQTAVEVAQKIKKLSSGGQVLVITHLHQIAREADFHYLAEKSIGADRRAVIEVKPLDAKAIKKELARMVAMPEEG